MEASLVSPEAWDQVVKVSVPLLGVLLAGNFYFATGMITRLKRLDDTVTGTFPVYNSRLQTVEAAAIQLAKDFKETAELRERIAVLEYALKTQKLIQA